MDFFSNITDVLAHKADEPFFFLLIIMTLIWTTGRLFTAIDLPHVLGEILAGIVLGPAVLDIVQETEFVMVLAELGIFFLMFHAGLDTSLKSLTRGSKTAFMASFVGVCAVVGAVFLAVSFIDGDVLEVSALGKVFMGLILSVVSFPIIMRLLRHFKIHQTPLGQTVLVSAIATELFVFVLTSVLLSLYSTGLFTIGNVLFIIFETIVFFVGTIFIGKCILPWFRRYLNTQGAKAFTFSLIVALCFGLFAEIIGLHLILGAYLGGIFVREEIENEKIFKKIEDRYFGFAYSFLGPIFFATVGLKISLDVFENMFWIILALAGLVVVVQVVSGGIIGKYLGKYSTKTALLFGAALTGRGAIDVVLTTLGYQAGIFNEDVFSVLIATTITLIFIAPFLIEFFVPQKHQ